MDDKLFHSLIVDTEALCESMELVSRQMLKYHEKWTQVADLDASLSPVQKAKLEMLYARIDAAGEKL